MFPSPKVQFLPRTRVDCTAKEVWWSSLLICLCFCLCRSTLVYVREENVFHHLDSLTPANSAPARLCAQKITPYLRGISYWYPLAVHQVQFKFASLLFSQLLQTYRFMKSVNARSRRTVSLLVILAIGNHVQLEVAILVEPHQCSVYLQSCSQTSSYQAPYIHYTLLRTEFCMHVSAQSHAEFCHIMHYVIFSEVSVVPCCSGCLLKPKLECKTANNHVT